MPGETDLHKLLKKEACRWMHRVGYQCIAAEVRLKPVGIIDAVGAGVFAPGLHHHTSKRSVHQTCFVECKASRGDFLRDLSNDGQMQLCLLERRTNLRSIRRSRSALRQHIGLGKFASCLLQPLANLHYILAPAELIRKTDLPPRWGLLSFGPGGVSVIVRPVWQECCHSTYVEGAIARTLTCDIYRADDRAMNSVNRAIMNAQHKLAARIRDIRSISVLADSTAAAPAESDPLPPEQTEPCG